MSVDPDGHTVVFIWHVPLTSVEPDGHEVVVVPQLASAAITLPSGHTLVRFLQTPFSKYCSELQIGFEGV